MADYLTRRDGVWQFVRKVPLAYRTLDPRVLVRQSTKVTYASDRNGRKAGRVAKGMNDDLEAYWRALASGAVVGAQERYDEARRRARAAGFEYLDSTELLQSTTDMILRRVEALALSREVKVPGTRAALLGTAPKPRIMLSELFNRFEALNRTAIDDMSDNQKRIWRNGKMRALKNLIEVTGDKALDEMTNDDTLNYNEYWQGRVLEEGLVVKTANRDIAHLSRMFNVINKKHRLGLPALFAGKRLEGSINASRPPFETRAIQDMIDSGVLMELNDEARRAFFIIADTGLRLSEAVNLNATTINLKADIPYISVRPDGRRMKTEQSERDIPLVGVSLAALRLQPAGFPRYVDKGGSLSAVVNKFLTAKGLRPTKKHSVYSLRHSFKDRLIAVKAPDSMIDSLMGHAGTGQKYGVGPQLDLKLEWLQQIALTSTGAI